jgi:FK506-binding nuclear protein
VLPSGKPGSLKRPRDSDMAEVEDGEKKLSKAEKKRLAKKLKAESGQAVTPEIEKKVNEGEPKDKKDKKDKKKEKDKEGKVEKDHVKAGEKKDGLAKDKEIAGGIKIKDMEVGTGPHAKKGNTVSMRYVGKLQSGKVFDKNVKGKPVSDH